MSTLFGRETETRELTGLIGGAAIAGQAMAMIGEPGIGKTALLAVLANHARASGFQVLVAAGVESETQFPFAGLHQVLRPVLGESERLAAAHRRALLTAFGLTEGPSPEFYLIALAAVSLIGAVAAKRPVAVLIDDVRGTESEPSPPGHRRGHADRLYRAVPGGRASPIRGARSR